MSNMWTLHLFFIVIMLSQSFHQKRLIILVIVGIVTLTHFLCSDVLYYYLQKNKDVVKKGLTEEEIKIELTKIIMKCTKDHPVEMSELMQLQSLIVPKKTESKCLLACAYKTEGIMTDKGLYDIEHAYKIAELTKNGDEKRLINAKKMADVCVKVNDVEVSDGEKGCERAALIFKCTIVNAPKFGFKI